jgi:hypothetical protein
MSIDFTAPPVCAKFMRSDAFGRLIAGPVGSGKTTSCVIELLRRAIEQKPATDGLRYTRFVVVRQTLRQLLDTVLKDTRQWFGPLGEWRISDKTFYLNFQDVRSEVVFIPLEDATDQARLLSMQITAAWLSEAIEMNFDVLAPISARCGRFPSGPQGTPSWFGIFGDTNFPTEMSPWHVFMENPTKEWQIFKQPSGLSPDAENLNWLLQTDATVKLPLDHPVRLAQGRKYYERLIDLNGKDSDWTRRYVHAEYGSDPSGLAVFRQTFKQSFHVVPDTLLIPGYPLIIGQDFGRNPWSLICQADHLGRLIVHEEVAATNMGLEKQINEQLKPLLLSDRYLGFKVALVGDPAGVAKGTIAEESSFDALKRMGLPSFPAPTNDIDPRLRAVEALLARQSMGGPALMINGPKCPMLVRALGGGYRFTKTKLGALRTVPEKNDKEGYSHVVDCLQYACLVVHGGMVDYISARLRPSTRKPRSQVTKGGWT